MNKPIDPLAVTRRHFFSQCGIGVGKIALASLLTEAFAKGASTRVDPLAVKQPHFAPTAKRVIHLFMAGARAISICSTTSRRW